MDKERERILGLIRAIAMAALELPPDQRHAFIERTVTTIQRKYERAYGADPDMAEQASKIVDLAKAMLKILEKSGGTIGHA